MTSADQDPPASTPPESSSSAQVRPPAGSGALEQVFWTIVSVGGLLLLVSGGLALLIRWLVGWDLIRPWVQVSATFAGVFLLVGVAIHRMLARARRLVMFAGGLLLLLAVADSLDGKQDFLPLITVLLTVWALIYADIIVQLLQSDRPLTSRRRLAVILGYLAIAGYLGTAGYYFIINLTTAPVIIDNHPLFVFGIIVRALLDWVGEIPPYGSPLSRRIRICMVCGLQNIPERQTCKRCSGVLGAVEQIS